MCLGCGGGIYLSSLSSVLCTVFRFNVSSFTQISQKNFPKKINVEINTVYINNR